MTFFPFFLADIKKKQYLCALNQFLMRVRGLKKIGLWLFMLCLASPVFGRNARVYGYVVDQDNVGIELANVVVLDAERPIGTSTNKNGYYELLLEEADTVVLSFSAKHTRNTISTSLNIVPHQYIILGLIATKIAAIRATPSP